MGERKQIVFCYDGEVRPEDTIVDPDGGTPVPEKGQIIKKHGQMWRVTFAMLQGVAGAEGYPVHKVYLARA